MAKVYMSTDSGAPQLSGQPGSLVSLLDAVLVDGYGVGVERKEGAGWTKEFTGANKRVYRNSPVSGTGFHLQVDDPGAAGNAGYAFVRGFSAMTGFDNGQNPTPAFASSANGVVVAKSSALDGSSRRWLIVADERIVYLFVNPWPAANNYHPYFFGDFISYKAGDTANWCIASNGLASFASNSDLDQYIFTTLNSYGSMDGSRPALFLPTTVASPTQAAVGYLVGGYRQGSYSAWGGDSFYSVTYPDPISQGLLFSAVQIFETGTRPRGQLPGIIAPLHNRPFPALVSQPAGQGMGGATSLLPVNFVAWIYSGAGVGQEGQVIFQQGGDWWQ